MPWAAKNKTFEYHENHIICNDVDLGVMAWSVIWRLCPTCGININGGQKLTKNFWKNGGFKRIRSFYLRPVTAKIRLSNQLQAGYFSSKNARFWAAIWESSQHLFLCKHAQSLIICGKPVNGKLSFNLTSRMCCSFYTICTIKTDSNYRILLCN